MSKSKQSNTRHPPQYQKRHILSPICIQFIFYLFLSYFNQLEWPPLRTCSRTLAIRLHLTYSSFSLMKKGLWEFLVSSIFMSCVHGSPYSKPHGLIIVSGNTENARQLLMSPPFLAPPMFPKKIFKFPFCV